MQNCCHKFTALVWKPLSAHNQFNIYPRFSQASQKQCSQMVKLHTEAITGE